MTEEKMNEKELMAYLKSWEDELSESWVRQIKSLIEGYINPALTDRWSERLFELSSYIDEKGWNIQAINRNKARKFIKEFLKDIKENR